MDNDYAELKRRVHAAGLMDKQPRYYVGKITATLLLLAASLAIFGVARAPLALALNAVFLAVVFGQMAYMLHDAAHRQIFAQNWQNTLLGIVFGNLLLGVSYSWWQTKHNAHHAHPNHFDADPEIDIPIIAYSPEQARASRGVARMMMRHQAFWFFPMLCLAAPMWYHASVLFLWNNRSRYRSAEIAAFVIHWLVYLALPVWVLGPGAALLVILIHQAMTGLYLASVFAPNHKGMLYIEPGMNLDFLRAQVLTARNVRRHPVIDWWYGGLNYQIEHHLFPTLPRNRLPEAQRIIKEYCGAIDVPYYETSMVTSYREILSYLHIASAPLRETTSLPVR